MAETKIEQRIGPKRVARGLWWGRPWGLVHGCTKVSAGCKHCWAELNTSRWRENNPALYLDLIQNGHWTNKIRILYDKLTVPRRARKPTIWAIWNDLFHKDVPTQFILDVLKVALDCSQHTFQILTKRPRRLQKILRYWKADLAAPNLWLGVSVEDQKTADERIPILLDIPAAIRFVSIEPMLGPTSVKRYLYCERQDPNHPEHMVGCDDPCDKCYGKNGVKWIILGCESGPGGSLGRPMKLEWARSIVEECRAARVQIFIKQLPVDGKLCHDISKFPPDLQIREFPNG